MKRTWHCFFLKFKFNRLFDNHFSIIIKSAETTETSSVIDLLTNEIFASFANNDMVDLIPRKQMSFMKIMNSNGPNTEPLGTQAFDQKYNSDI